MVTKMKKLLSVLLLIIVFSSLSACGKRENSQPVSDDPTNGINNGLKSNEYGDTVTDYGTQACEKTSFEIGKDDQPFFISKTGMNISNGSGEYTFYNNTLYYYDNKVQKAVIACGKPDCQHITNVDEGESDCNAFFPNSIFYFDKGYAYYNDNIYMLGRGSDSDNSVSLYKISSDASKREEVLKLFETSDINNIGVFTIHRKYAFWSLNTQKGTQLFRMNLDDKKVEQVFRENDNGVFITRFIGAGDYLYFSYSYATDESYDNWDGYICRLNIHSGQTKKIINTTGCYTVMNNKIYYFDSNKFFQCELNGENNSNFIDAPDDSWLIVGDTKYLYLTNWDNEITDSSSYKIFVVSTDGKIIDTIPISDCEFFRGGLSDNLYIETTDRKLKVFAKNQIGTGKYNWKTIYTVSDTGEVILNE